MVHMLRRVDAYSVAVWRDLPGCWSWYITLIGSFDRLASATRMFANRRDVKRTLGAGCKS